MATAPDYAKSKVEINNFLGDSFNSYKKKVYALAVSDTKLYFSQREDIIAKVKHQLTKDMYDTVYNLLTEGKDKNGADLVLLGGAVGAGILTPPSMPIQQVNNQAISMASAISEMLLELIDEILPHDAEEIFKKKLITIAQAPPV